MILLNVFNRSGDDFVLKLVFKFYEIFGKARNTDTKTSVIFGVFFCGITEKAPFSGDFSLWRIPVAVAV